MKPRATIRVQFSGTFTLDDAVDLVPYFDALGISHVYASPILAARPGSSHGYDVIDPNQVNQALGGMPALLRLSAALKQHGMGLILDIVPNHMAADAANPWWWDVLRYGRDSRYAAFFDIDWEDPDPELHGRIMLPVLGDSLERCIARGELGLEAEANGSLVCRYFDGCFPIDPRSNGSLADGDDQKQLNALLRRQNYALSPWQETPQRINWRRFFDINQLVALRMERAEVFDAYHRLALDLIRDGMVDGVRVDHVDGLAEPDGYCRRLREALDAARPDDPPYFVVEKILDKDESLNPAWPADGTTGYDFMDQVAAVLHDPDGEAALSECWRRMSGDPRGFAAVARDARREMLERLFPKQLDRLLALAGSAAPPEIRSAMIALLAAMHRYRLYGAATGFSGDDLAALEDARKAASDAVAPGERAALDGICAALKEPTGGKFCTRFEQLSATLTAKAVEDTAFYRYGRLLSRNEVGSDPGRLAITVKSFHAYCRRRWDATPQAMLATATHDHKRGEDNRARLAVLSEIAEEWLSFVASTVERGGIDPAIQLIVLQGAVGAWPLNFDAEDAAARESLRQRLAQWLIKSLREAKQVTSWTRPDASFEEACLGFLERMMDPKRLMLGELARFVARIGPAGAVNSLTQTLLRLTVPGVPDLYRGTEFWDFSLVDPDNRAPVDFAVRRAALGASAPLDALLTDWRSGRVKQALIARMLAFRRRHARLFSEGSYEPLAITGPHARYLIGFVRRREGDALIVLAPRLSARALGAADRPRFPGGFWADTRIEWPTDLKDRHAEDLLYARDSVTVGAVERILAPASWAALHLPRK